MKMVKAPVDKIYLHDCFTVLCEQYINKKYAVD